jgi:hypothetical protein
MCGMHTLACGLPIIEEKARAFPRVASKPRAVGMMARLEGELAAELKLP